MTDGDRRESISVGDLNLETRAKTDGERHLFDTRHDNSLCFDITVLRGSKFGEEEADMIPVEEASFAERIVAEDPPPDVCKECWRACFQCVPHLEDDPIGRELEDENAYLFRWHQAEREDEEWYDVYIHEGASIDAFDRLLSRFFTTLDESGFRVYAPYHDNYPSRIVPTHQLTDGGLETRREYTYGESALFGDLVKNIGLSQGGRVQIVDEEISQSGFYGELKETISMNEFLETFSDTLAYSQCVTFVGEKRPEAAPGIY